MWKQCSAILLLFIGFTTHGSQAIKHQWASEVTKFSSQYSAKGCSAKKILGRPNVYPRYSASGEAWAQAAGQKNERQFIEVKFPDKVYPTNVFIYETYNAGGVKRILARDAKNRWIEIFGVSHAVLIKKARKFSPKIKKVNFPVNELRIEVDCTVSRSYVYIDAVEIVGGDCPRQFQKYGDSCYMIKKDKVTADMAFANCLETGGYLANFETLEEAMRMKKTLKKMNTGLSFYVGGRNINRRKPGGDWRWIRNGKMTKMTYHAFGAGEPNGTDRAPQDCMLFFAPDRYTFHAGFCDSGSYPYGYICEI